MEYVKDNYNNFNIILKHLSKKKAAKTYGSQIAIKPFIKEHLFFEDKKLERLSVDYNFRDIMIDFYYDRVYVPYTVTITNSNVWFIGANQLGTVYRVDDFHSQEDVVLWLSTRLRKDKEFNG